VRTQHTIAALLLVGVVTGCAMPQYRARLVAFPGAKPQMPASQVQAICQAQAQGARASAKGSAQARIDAQNNRVTGYNCATYGQASAHGNHANYSGATNCAAVTANPYGGKYGALAAVGDGLSIAADGSQAYNTALRGCAAQHGYQIERYCVANCGDSSHRSSFSPTATPTAGGGTPSQLSAARSSSNAELCYIVATSKDESVQVYSQRVLAERKFTCERGAPRR